MLPGHTKIADNVNDKAGAFNGRLGDLDALLGTVLDIDVDSSNAYTVPESDFYKAGVIRVDDAAGANGDITITVPSTARPMFAVRNDTGQRVYVQVSGQTPTRYVAAGNSAHFFYQASEVDTPHGVAGGGGARDPDFANVVLLVPFDGTDGDTTTTDHSNSAHTVTFDTNAEIDDAQSVFGGTSLLPGGSPGGVYVGDHANFDLGSDPFTIEGWFYRTGSGTLGLFSKYLTTGNQRSYELLYSTSGTTLRFWSSSTGSSGSALLTSTGYDITANTWHYLALDFDGTTYRLYAGTSGTAAMIASSTSTLTFFNSSADFTVGARVGGASPWSGNIDDFRFTKGVARYASDSGFVIPTAAHPLS